MILSANGPDLVVSDEVDENGVVEFALHNSSGALTYGALTVSQALALVDHLNEIVTAKNMKDEGYVWRDDEWRPHWCTEPLGERCYWSGGRYASHGVGF
jgi:hypothetical protein